MMKVVEWANRKIKTFNAWYIGALKIFCTICGMVIGAYYPDFIRQYVWWLVAVAAVLFVFLVVKYFRAKA